MVVTCSVQLKVKNKIFLNIRLYCHVVCVTIDGVWNGEWIYRPLIHTAWIYKQLQWRFFSFMHSDPLFTASHTELNYQAIFSLAFNISAQTT
jgi:hypothetical protein